MAEQHACQVLAPRPVLGGEKVLGSYPLWLSHHSQQRRQHLLHTARRELHPIWSCAAKWPIQEHGTDSCFTTPALIATL